MNFTAYLTKNNLIDPTISAFMTNNCDLVGANFTDGGIGLWARQMADYAYIGGYTDTTGKVWPPGDGARTAWINDETTAWNNLPYNKWQANVILCLGDSDTVIDPNLGMDGNGNATYTYDGITYNWSHDSTAKCPFSEKDIIMAIINGQSKEGKDGAITVNPFYTTVNLLSMEKDYRMQTLTQLLKGIKDPIWAILLFFSNSVDGQAQAKMSAHAKQSDDLSAWQVYSTTLNQAMKAFTAGTGKDTDAHNFVLALFGAKAFCDNTPSLSGLDPTFVADVYNAVLNIGDSSGDTLMQLITQQPPLSDGALADALNKIFNTDSTTGTSTPNSNAQTANNAANTFTNQVTGQSKNLVTLQASDASTESAFVKFGGSITSMQSQLGKTFTSNQKSS